MTWVMSWLGNTITTLGGWDLDSNVALTSCHPSSTHPSKFRLSELLPVLWFLSPSLAAAWHTLIFQAELPIFHSGFQNSDKESPSKMMSEVFFFLSLGISVFNGNLIHLSPKKKPECCIRGFGQNLCPGILFLGTQLITLCSEKKASEKSPERQPFPGVGWRFSEAPGERSWTDDVLTHEST